MVATPTNTSTGNSSSSEAPQHERQPDQRLPDARQAETPPMPLGLGGDVGRGGGRIGDRKRLHRRPVRSARRRASSSATGRLIRRNDQPFGGEGATEHQRQFPGDIEQLVIGGGIVGGAHDPVIERRKMRQRPRHVGDLARDFADCSDTVSSSCAPRLSAVSGIGDCGAGAARCGARLGRRGIAGEALAIARSVSIICARLVSSCSVSSARLA